VRLYESQGRGAKALLVAGFPFREAQEANMLEEASGALELSGDGIALEFGPFQIRTVIVRP
jgi:alpha-mannosidase